MIDYPLVQERIIPEFCIATINAFFAFEITKLYKKIDPLKLNDPLVKEVHAICSFIKFECSYKVMDSLIKFRDLLGG